MRYRQSQEHATIPEEESEEESDRMSRNTVVLEDRISVPKGNTMYIVLFDIVAPDTYFII